MKIQKVEMTFDPTGKDFYCPFTGKVLIGENATDEKDNSTAFIYLDFVSEFDYLADELTYLEDEATKMSDQEEEDFFPCFLKLLKKNYHNRELLLFELTGHGMACGPITATVMVGI